MGSVTVFDHGYIGMAIVKAFEDAGIRVNHERHERFRQAVIGTLGIVNAAGYTGSPNVDAC